MSHLYITNPIEIENGGLFVSNGSGTHPKRVLNSFELIFVCQGTLSMREGETIYHLQQGDILLLHPNMEHEGAAPYTHDVKFYWVHFHLSKFSKSSRSDTVIELVKSGQVTDSSKVVALFNLLLHEQELGMDKTTLNLILLLIIREIGVKNAGSHQAKPVSLANHAQSLIRRFYRDPITPSSLAGQLQCNVDYLGRVYKHSFGQTLSEAIQAKKIQAAKQDLVELNAPIEHIAKCLGYQDAGYFRRVFVKHVGITPAEYKKLYSIRTINAD